MKYLFAVISLAAVVLEAFGADSVWVNGQAVIVNDTMITREEVEGSIADAIQTLYRRYARQPQVLNQKITELRRDRLQMLIDRQLILQEFKAKGYNVPESVFEKELNRTIREQFGDRLKLNKTLQAQGMTYESYARQNREQLIVDLITHEFVSPDKIMVSPLKIQTYYAQNPDQFKVEDQVKLRMIVIAQASDAPAGTARKLADEIMAKLNEGASFAEMASIYSSGSQRSREATGAGWSVRSCRRTSVRLPSTSRPASAATS